MKHELGSTLRHLCGLHIEPRGLFMTLRHSVTRFRITLECYEARLVAGGDEMRRRRSPESCQSPIPIEATSAEQPYVARRWLRLGDLADYPLSTTARRIATFLSEKVLSHELQQFQDL